MPIDTTVTWDDLIAAQETELDDLRESYGEVTDLAREEHGDDALDRPLPSDLDAVDDDKQDLAVLQQQAAMMDASAKVLQRRIHLLETLQEELGDGDFTIKMLSGQEAMNVEVDLRTDAEARDGDTQTVQLVRNQRTTDAAVTDAPDGVPTDDEGSPLPSECPNALVNSLFEQVQRFNAAGAADFRAEGFGGPGPAASAASGSSATPSDSAIPSANSGDTDESVPERGDTS